MNRIAFTPVPAGEEAHWRTIAAEFARSHLAPTAIEDDEKCLFRRSVFAEAAKKGLVSVSLSPTYGGAGASYLCHYAVLEEIGRVSLSFAVTLGVTNLIQGAIAQFGTKAQKEHFLPKLITGELLAAFSLSEPNAGSDSASLRLKAEPAPGGFRLSGNKCWCSTAGHADLYLVMARTGEHRARGVSAFLVPKDAPGFRVGKEEKKLGLRSSSLCELIFENCFVSDEQRVGDIGQGLEVALSQLDAGRVTIGTVGLGAAIEVLERGWRYRAAQASSGRPFEDGEQQLLGDYYAQIQALRSLVRETALARDRGERVTTLASSVKLLGSDLAVRLASEVVTLMGEAGYVREYEVERMLRDAKALQIVEGTNQIQRLVLARELKGALS